MYTCSHVCFNLDIGKKSGHVVWILGVEILPALKKSMRSRVTPSLSNLHRWSRHIQYLLHNCNFKDGHKISFLVPSWWPAASPHQDGEGGTIACQDQRRTCTTAKCIRWLLFPRYQELCQHLQVFDLLTVVNCFGSLCWQLKHLLAASCWQLWHLTLADYC